METGFRKLQPSCAWATLLKLIKTSVSLQIAYYCTQQRKMAQFSSEQTNWMARLIGNFEKQ